MQMPDDISGYRFRDETIPAHGYMVPPIRTILAEEFGSARERIFEVGCGKGDMAHALSDTYDIVGIDPSREGIALANLKYPHLDLRLGSAYDDLAANFGSFKAAMSVDVVEYVAFPHKFAANIFELLADGGIAIVSAPYHGYLKNIAIAASGSMDFHFNSSQDYGRIKFWSIKTLGALMRDAGFVDITFRRVGRVPPLAKAMICIARKPPAS